MLVKKDIEEKKGILQIQDFFCFFFIFIQIFHRSHYRPDPSYLTESEIVVLMVLLFIANI